MSKIIEFPKNRVSSSIENTESESKIVDSLIDPYKRDLIEKMSGRSSKEAIRLAKESLQGQKVGDVIELINNTNPSIIETQPAYFTLALKALRAMEKLEHQNQDASQLKDKISLNEDDEKSNPNDLRQTIKVIK